MNIIANAVEATLDDLARLNKLHAVLPIGGKTRVVTFGVSEKYPTHSTIIMTQPIADFKSLNNKYRHTWVDDAGEPQSMPLGTYWINSAERRQYDGGMAFMPQHTGDVDDKLNLWRGFGCGVDTRGAKGCPKFLAFAHEVICSGVDAHYDYLIKREAFIAQKRTRSEIALGLRSDEEGVGKGFYEKTMRHLCGTHAMQLNNPDHIIGKFNPHLEPLLRLTADEALFVGNPKHRNALFGLVTEPEMTIEPKNCGVYVADSYLNISITCNSKHFLPAGPTARRFFAPTVSNKYFQNFTYFGGLQAELDAGGYGALLYHLLHEVSLTGFNVRAVPKTAELAAQAAYSRKGIDLLVEVACHEALAPCQNGAPAGVSVCADDANSVRQILRGLDHYIDNNPDQDLKRLGQLKVKRQLVKEWGCITGDAARLTVGNVQRYCVKWPALRDLRAKFEAKHGKQDWLTAATDWLDACPF